MKRVKPGLVERGLARRYRGKLLITPKGRERLVSLQTIYDRIPARAVEEFIEFLREKPGLGRRSLPGIMTRNIAISGKGISLARVGAGGRRRSIVVKRAFFPHTVTKRQYFFMRALQRAFERAIQGGALKPKYYAFYPVKYLHANGQLIIARYYPRPSVADIVYEMDRKKLLMIMKKRKPAGIKYIKKNIKHPVLEKRLKAIIDLGRIGTDKAKEMLLNLLESSKSPLTRGFSCFALALTGDLKMKRALDNKRLTDESPFVRWRAAVAMYMLKKVRRGTSDISLVLPKNDLPSIFLANNPGITYTGLRRMFEELRKDFDLVKPAAEKSVKKYHGYKRFHLDIENIGNLIVYGFDGKEKFTVGLIDIG